MNGKFALTTIATACALCIALVGCGGGSASSSAAGSAAASTSAASAASSSAASASAASAASSSAATSSASSAASSSAASGSASASAASSSAASASGEHDGYFVGKWDLYESDEYTHDQIVQVMDQYANDKEYRAKMNEAYGRDNVEFCATFNSDGTGEIDTGLEVVPFTWEATNDGAVTFTSFGGKETAMHLPVENGMFTLNGDTYAKVG